MKNKYTIFVVDNDKLNSLILKTMLGGRYAVELFETAEDCLRHAKEELPDLFILDVELPGMDGFEMCKHLKGSAEADSIPVVFLTAHDDPADMLVGYDAGAQDYIVKPFDVIGLYRKIENLQRIEQQRKSLAAQAKASDEVVTAILGNLDEYAVLIRFLRRLNECVNTDEIVEVVLNMLDMLHLKGAVQLRMRNFEKTYSHAGENWPLEVSVINHVRNLDSIFQFKDRAAFNYKNITILVVNMPIDDSDMCGRIRDNLAISAESADSKLRALQSFEDNAMMRDEIHDILQGINDTVSTFSRRYENARAQGGVYTAQFITDLLASFAHLGMTERQENEVLEMVKIRSNGLISLYDIARETQSALGVLGDKLEAILQATHPRI